MKRLFVLACAAAMLAACSEPKAEDPAVTAIKSSIAGIVGDDAKITVFSFEKMDSTTFGQEIEHRLGVQKMAEVQNAKYANKYNAVGKSQKSLKKRALMERNKEIAAGLEAIRARMADSLDVVAYYDYKFSGKAEKEDTVTEFNEYWASVTPSCEVLNINPKQKGLHTNLGKVIPGYSALLGK